MSWGRVVGSGVSFQHFPLFGLSVNRAKTLSVRASPAPVTPSAWGRSALARSALARSWQKAPADVAPSASAQVVRGAVARHSGLPSAARILATSSRPPAASFAVQTRPPCALLPLPGQPRPAGLALQSLRSILLSSPSAPGLGLASATAWG
jgi:hypothetical protein